MCPRAGAEAAKYDRGLPFFYMSYIIKSRTQQLPHYWTTISTSPEITTKNRTAHSPCSTRFSRRDSTHVTPSTERSHNL